VASPLSSAILMDAATTQDTKRRTGHSLVVVKINLNLAYRDAIHTLNGLMSKPKNTSLLKMYMSKVKDGFRTMELLL